MHFQAYLSIGNFLFANGACLNFGMQLRRCISAGTAGVSRTFWVQKRVSFGSRGSVPADHSFFVCQFLFGHDFSKYSRPTDSPAAGQNSPASHPKNGTQFCSFCAQSSGTGIISTFWQRSELKAPRNHFKGCFSCISNPVFSSVTFFLQTEHEPGM